MAHRSLFAKLRGSDGRSIGRALLLLVLVNALLAGLHTGALASQGPGAICTLAQPAGGGGGPAPHPDIPLPCCFAGCLVAAPALPPAAAVLAPLVLVFIGRADPAVSAEPAPVPVPQASARGPPPLA